LCASATVVGVSAVGYALGRPEQPLEASSSAHSTSKRETSSDLNMHAIQSQSESSSRILSPLSAGSPYSLTADSPPQIEPRLSEDLHTLPRSRSRKARRLTAGDLVWQQHSDYSRAIRSVGEDEPVQSETRVPLRSRPSWMKRLSTLSISSREQSPLDSPPPPRTPSILTSNGSTLLSHAASSTAPMVGSRPPLPPGPNKLIKRSSSIRSAHGPFSPNPAPKFRRPATSHQRSATFQGRTRPSSLVDEEFGSPKDMTPDDHARSSEPQWRQYFRSK
ncbi:hypothetical protein LTS18_014431, partial [Coniosporium uncinatum]